MELYNIYNNICHCKFVCFFCPIILRFRAHHGKGESYVKVLDDVNMTMEDQDIGKING